MRKEDEHILKALMKSEPQKIAISINLKNSDVESSCEGFRHRIYDMYIKLRRDLKKEIPEPEVIFFNAQSKGCWKS
jgi:hypothetical protein